MKEKKPRKQWKGRSNKKKYRINDVILINEEDN